MKYSDYLANWLSEAGYTHCFFVAGGNIMHLLESLSHKLTCIPVVHEVAAGIAAEYFNATAPDGGKALAMVTAGPGLTNIVTAFAGAFLESRELLVLGGQVKTSDLSHGEVRQRGIQEIDGVSIVRPISSASVLLDTPLEKNAFLDLCSISSRGRPGPVFIEIPLDVQAKAYTSADEIQNMGHSTWSLPVIPSVDQAIIQTLLKAFSTSLRPAILIGGGVSSQLARKLADFALENNLPVFTTWNAADRIPADHPCYFGRPNTWGQRYSNLLLQQADFILALGSRLGLQQTGFNWQEFGKGAFVAQVDCDEAELKKGHPRVDLAIHADVNLVLPVLMERTVGNWAEWKNYCSKVKSLLPPIEENVTHEGYLSPYLFVQKLSELAVEGDVIIPCSSGGAFTVMMQIFAQKMYQRIVTNKGLASMGYGLSGAIGAAIANPDKRVLLVEGDGGFSQNLQEIGTAAINNLNLKIFIFDDAGYASIRMTQRNYFGGRYVGCDRITGLGLPNWEQLFLAYGVESMRLVPGFAENEKFSKLFNQPGVAAFIVSVDPEQTYFPKITSRVTSNGMESNPLHLMSPDLSPEIWAEVSKFIVK